MQKTYSVSELNRVIKKKLENEFSQILIQGEITGFKCYNSGHWYFSIKDNESQISCSMWKYRNISVFFTPHDGMKVLIKGKISVYEVKGTYQIDVFEIQPLGVGELQIAFDKLKNKLSAEGLFDEANKKRIPEIPLKVGIATSRDGAALRDVIAVFRRRFPVVELIICHTSVQGAGASIEIKAAIENLNKVDDLEIILLCRGGGSLEDLWAFNEEITAKAIFSSKIPIITGIGHEIDFTIADFVADFRAATPTAAAELITPNITDLNTGIVSNFKRLSKKLEFRLDAFKEELRVFSSSYSFKLPSLIIDKFRQKIDHLYFRLLNQTGIIITAHKKEIFGILRIIENSKPENILKRGYTIIKQNKNIIQSKNEVDDSADLLIEFFDGEITTNVKKENII